MGVLCSRLVVGIGRRVMVVKVGSKAKVQGRLITMGMGTPMG